MDVISPRTGVKVGTVDETPVESLPSIVKRAGLAQVEWAKKSLKERSLFVKAFARELHNARNEVAAKIGELNGKTDEEALICEIFPTLSSFNFFASRARKALKPERVFLKSVPFAKSEIRFEPLGVVAVISPWNYPFSLSLADIPAALMAGNAVILKPSEYSPGIGNVIDGLFKKAGFPADLVQIVYGKGDLGAALVSSGVHKVSFTGSTSTGRKVYEACARAMIPCQLELGGKDPAIVLEDADLDDAADGILWSAFVNMGQTCASVERVFVAEGVVDEFVSKLRSSLMEIPDSNFGTMNTLLQRDIVKNQLNDALEKKGRVLAERVLTTSDNPFKMNATIVGDVPDTALLHCEETFGPVLSVVPFRTVEEVVAKVNESKYALTASIWTRDYKKGERLANRIAAGVVTINEHMVTGGFAESPWLGQKSSGIGFSKSVHAYRAFSKMKYVYHDRGWIRFSFWRYPMNDRKRKWLGKYFESQFSPSWLKKGFRTLQTAPKLLVNLRGSK